MVNITPEEVMEQRKIKTDLTEMDRKIIGGTVRIDIPMDNRSNLAKYADLFESLGENFRTLSRTTHMNARQALIEASYQAFCVRRRIQEIAGTEPKIMQPRRARLMGRLET
jgi:hypothetical protein